MEIITWDSGECDKIHPLWEHYYQTCDALIFVIDSNDKDKIDSNAADSARPLFKKKT